MAQIISVAEGLRMSQELPLFLALPVWVIVYAGAIWACAKAAKGIIELMSAVRRYRNDKR